jgi:phytanoyl-CoA hydroxylase
MPVLTDSLSETLPGDIEGLVRRFHEYGYVVVRGLLDPKTDVQPVLDEYADLLDRLAHEWHAAGELSSAFDELPFEQRVIAVTSEVGAKLYDHLRIFFNPPSRTTADSPIHYGPGIFGLLTHPKLLDVIETLVGPEITLTPVNILRMKIPEHRLPTNKKFHVGMSETYWHQDQGTYSEDIAAIDVLTCWLPLTDARREMGCLQVVPGSHTQSLSVHCGNRGAQKIGIPERLLGSTRHYIEMKPGDVHFHHRLLQHGSLRNVSDRLRLSIDLRYQPTDQEPGHALGVPRGFRIPGVVVRSRRNAADEMHEWHDWRAYHEAMRLRFMAVDWKTCPPVTQFTAEHEYCL